MRRLLLLPCVLLLVAGLAEAKPRAPAVSPGVAADFVRRSCRSTSYPRVCESTLLPCAPAVGRSPRRLARAALVVCADRARNCSAYMRGGGNGAAASVGGAMKDCAELARDAEEQLRQSVAEMDRMGRAGSPRFAWSLSNVQTWASAALTDTSTCLDSLRHTHDAKDKDAVRRRLVAVAQATSNALALVNKLVDPAPHRL
ncbi:21 kDa protein-like [Phragmites australis]|uniref:21 kDa protein-like n=1 Tax=Phragmites australis TaxID=29695 RepID=UPI002D79BB51|nr:21 kDa protein-like [Phragmites australis]